MHAQVNLAEVLAVSFLLFSVFRRSISISSSSHLRAAHRRGLYGWAVGDGGCCGGHGGGAGTARRVFAVADCAGRHRIASHCTWHSNDAAAAAAAKLGPLPGRVENYSVPCALWCSLHFFCFLLFFFAIALLVLVLLLPQPLVRSMAATFGPCVPPARLPASVLCYAVLCALCCSVCLPRSERCEILALAFVARCSAPALWQTRRDAMRVNSQPTFCCATAAHTPHKYN